MDIREAIHNLELCLQYQDYIPLEEISLLLEFIKKYQWQTIETAPKDGQAVLVGNERFISQSEYGHRGFGYGWFTFDCVMPPTHWMPLPQLPPKD